MTPPVHAVLREKGEGLLRPETVSVPNVDDGRSATSWQTIDSAPKDGFPIQASIPGHGDDNIIVWVWGVVEGEHGLSGSWVFATDQEPPDDWTDGYCWAVNDAGVRSSWPTHWKRPILSEGAGE